VAQAGSWQQAEIRKAATLGVAGVVANASTNAATTNPATTNPVTEDGASPGVTSSQTQASARASAPLSAALIVAQIPLTPQAQVPVVSVPPAVAAVSQVPTLSPFAVATTTPAAAANPNVPIAPVVAIAPVATVPVSNVPVVQQPAKVAGVPTVNAGVPLDTASVDPATAAVASTVGQVQAVQPTPVQALPEQPPVTVPDLSSWRKSGKAVARAHILPTAVVPATTIVETTVAPKVGAEKNISSAVSKRTTNP
jgi:hypothetical protein